MQLKAVQTTVMMLIGLMFVPLAQAHTGVQATAGLTDGFIHPLTGLDHILVAVAAGLWAAKTGKHCVLWAMLFLPLLSVGMLLGVVGHAFLHTEVISILIFILGVAVVAMVITLPHAVAYLVFGSFAIYHGVVHMLEMPQSVSVGGYAAGLLMSTGFLLLLGIILRQVIMLHKPHSVTPG